MAIIIGVIIIVLGVILYILTLLAAEMSDNREMGIEYSGHARWILIGSLFVGGLVIASHWFGW